MPSLNISSTICSCSTVTQKLPFLATCDSQKLPKLATYSCQTWEAISRQSCNCFQKLPKVETFLCKKFLKLTNSIGCPIVSQNWLWSIPGIGEYKAYWHINFSLINGCATCKNSFCSHSFFWNGVISSWGVLIGPYIWSDKPLAMSLICCSRLRAYLPSSSRCNCSLRTFNCENSNTH